MLGRASSDAGTRLRRSKSTSTVHRHAPPITEPLNPDVAQQHAVAAATAAFARSQAQKLVEHKANRSVEPSRSKSTASRKSLTSQGSHFPLRELTVRSVPSQKSAQTTTTHRPSVVFIPNTERFPALDPALGGDRPSSSIRPLSAQPSVTFSEYACPVSQPKSHRQSGASSITSQQIRKARSMYYASSVQTGSPIARPPAKYLTTLPPISPSPVLSIAQTTYIPTRSTGPSPLAMPRVPVTVAPDETIHDARDKYLKHFQQRSIKHKPSLFLAPFKRQQDQSNDKSKLHSQNIVSALSTRCHVMDESVVDNTISDFVPQAQAKGRRSFSGSLKRKIKKVFRRSPRKSPELPVQQIEASRVYFGFNDTSMLHMKRHGDIPSPDEELLQKVRSRTPSLDGSRPRLLVTASRSSSRGSARSNRSLHSEANVSLPSSSRVTSWGTSTSGETLTQRAIKRLTIIHEARDSIGSISDRSASTSTKRKSLPPPLLLAFKDPMHMESLAEEASTPSVDPKRVFSALMREIDTSRSGEDSKDQADRTSGVESDVFDSSRTKELNLASQGLHSSASREFGLSVDSEKRPSAQRPASVAACSVRSKKSSMRSFGRAIRSTIRTVTPGEHHSSPCAAHSASTDENASTPSSEASSRSQINRDDRTTIFKGLCTSKKKSASIKQEASVETYTPATEQIETRVRKAKARWQTPLNESTSPQFPRETDLLYTAVDFAQQQSAGKGYATCEPPASPQSPAIQPWKPIETPMSPSVYSRDTDGVSILPNDSVMSFNSPYEHERSQHGGSAIILTSQSVRSYVIGTPSPNRRSSTRSSQDWKVWLSHEVSGIETHSQGNITMDGQSATPSGLHKPDLTQPIRTSHTGLEDTTVIVRESLEGTTPRVHLKIGLHHIEQRGSQSNDPITSSTLLSTGSEGIDGGHHTFEDASPGHAVPSENIDTKGTLLTPIALTSCISQDCSTSTPSGSPSSSQPPLGTPKSAYMNERFPFLNTGRRSSSNHSGRSYDSKSPTSSVVSSLKSSIATPGPKVVYSDIFAPALGFTAHHVSNESKENITPSSMGSHKRPTVSPLDLVSRPRSRQPLSPTALNARNTTNELIRLERASNPTETVVAGPNLRVTIRSLSPGKRSQRPRSAFQLRNTPSSRPTSELRRSALQPNISSRLLVHDDDTSPSIEAPHCAMIETAQCDGSVTHGQRMAERFLKERKSVSVLERGGSKSAGKFVREDTPAFL